LLYITFFAQNIIDFKNMDMYPKLIDLNALTS